MFTDAIQYMQDCHKESRTALNNVTRKQWFAVPAVTMPALIAKFDSTAENTRWSALYESGRGVSSGPDVVTTSALRAQIAFLCGCRRDVRMQFAAGNADRQRGSLDWDRYMQQRLTFIQARLELIKQRLVMTEADGAGGTT